MNQAVRYLVDQGYFVGLALLNRLHGCLPFFLRPALYSLCSFDIDRTATLQGGIRFFHVGRLKVGEDSVVNRDVYLDNRGGLTIGRHVSIAHGARIYTMGHDVHDALFRTKSNSVSIEDYAVVFAGAVIMPGVTLAEGCVVMAGAVVTKSVAPYRIVGGNPARDIGPRNCSPSYRLKRRFWFAH
ncbi:acyltransferase [Variovorax soli]